MAENKKGGMSDTGIERNVRVLTNRIAFVEERYKTFEGRLRQLQKDVVEQNNDIRRLVRDLDKRVLDLNAATEKILDKLKTLRNEVLLRASKEDLVVLKKYIDAWDPFQFVTVDNIDEIVQEILDKKLKPKS